MTRDEAIKYLIIPVATSTEIGEEKQKEFEAYNMAIEALSKERTGEWVDREQCQVDEDAYDVAICSNCKAEITLEYSNDNYCPNCGAKMKGGTENDR